MAKVNAAKEKLRAVQRQAIGIAGKAGQNEGNLIKDITAKHGAIDGSSIRALGQLYPTLNDKFQASAQMVDKLYDDYLNEQNDLNSSITEYNMYISKFPTNIYAGILGYKKDSLIDEENLEMSKELDRVDDVDISSFV
ncbi:MAG: LemA family protein [Lachnospiraceae bacterium]|nr:LemA family protein [Lachnospiraceae bacterium]